MGDGGDGVGKGGDGGWLSHLALEESIVLEKHRGDLESPVLWGDVIEVFRIVLFHIISEEFLFLTK